MKTDKVEENPFILNAIFLESLEQTPLSRLHFHSDHFSAELSTEAVQIMLCSRTNLVVTAKD